MADFQFFHDFIFINGSAISSALQWVVLGVKFYEWSASAEFTYLEKNQLYGSMGWEVVGVGVVQKEYEVAKQPGRHC